MLELGHEAVEDGLRLADGARGGVHVARHGIGLQRGAALGLLLFGQAHHNIDVGFAADEDAKANFQVAIIGVQ